jgi:hypothetical protein
VYQDLAVVKAGNVVDLTKDESDAIYFDSVLTIEPNLALLERLVTEQRPEPASARRTRRAPVGEQLGLQAEHLGVLLGLAVVVAEQVQHAVRGEQLQLGGGAVPASCPWRSATSGHSTDVAQQRRHLVLVVLAGAAVAGGVRHAA